MYSNTAIFSVDQLQKYSVSNISLEDLYVNLRHTKEDLIVKLVYLHFLNIWRRNKGIRTLFIILSDVSKAGYSCLDKMWSLIVPLPWAIFIFVVIFPTHKKMSVSILQTIHSGWRNQV